MKKLIALTLTLLSLSAFAGAQYKFKSAHCDGSQTDISGGAEDFSFIVDFQTELTASLNMMFKGIEEGTEFIVALQTPVKLNNISDNRYSMSENGNIKCSMTVTGQTYDCSGQADSTIPTEEFTMSKNESALILTFDNYTDDDISCTTMVMDFSRI